MTLDEIRQAMAETDMHLERFKSDHRMTVCEDIIRAQQKALTGIVEHLAAQSSEKAAQTPGDLQ